MPSNKQENTQTQQVSQSTTVTVQNVIESAKLEPIERLAVLADVFAKIDQVEQASKAAPQTVLSVQQIPGAAFLTQPGFVILAAASVAVLIILNKRLKK